MANLIQKFILKWRNKDGNLPFEMIKIAESTGFHKGMLAVPKVTQGSILGPLLFCFISSLCVGAFSKFFRIPTDQITANFSQRNREVCRINCIERNYYKI